MAGETAEESVSVALPSDLAEWLDERASTDGVDREELLVQLLGAYRVAADIEDGDAAAALDSRLSSADGEFEQRVERLLDERQSNIEDRVDSLENRESAVTNRVDSIEDRLSGQLDDVRKRVLQVKQEADGKAPADHDHEDLESQLANHQQRIADLQDELNDLAGRLDSFEEEMDPEAVADRLDDAEAKLSRLARAVVQLRDQVADGSDALSELKRTANREGIDTARCGACDERVDIALLAEAACPHCGTDVRGVKTGGGVFGKPRLVGTAQQADQDGDSQ